MIERLSRIELACVDKSYRSGEREQVVFRGLNATLRGGELTVLLGRSGTGKSTLLNLISGIDLPDSGEVRLDRACLNRLSERERTLFRRRNVGFVFQSFNLVPTLTVLENLRLPLELNGVRADDGMRRASEILERVGLLDRGWSFPDQLSGGEQQRVAIARALVHHPAVVLADEPTGNLDQETGAAVLHLLVELTREAGRTLIMVTHSPEAETYADSVLVLGRDGLRRREPARA